MEQDEVVSALRAACENAGGQKAWASANGVSYQFVGDVLHGRRQPSDAVLRPLGLVRTVSYEPVGDKP
jgi:hypothetical protein